MKNVSKFLLALMAILTIGACKSGDNGQLTGVLERPKWKETSPYGMAYIPSGTLTIGPSDQDVSFSLTQRPKSISIQGFYMDETEITNNEYRQFVYWVRDSIARTRLDMVIEMESGETRLDWDQELNIMENMEDLEDMFYPEEERFSGRYDMDSRKYVFDYQWYDWKGAAHDNYKSNRTKFIKKDQTEIYPDTLVWIRDFTYSYNEPYTRNYFNHPAFDDYPVVGVDWKRANAFAYWRTKYANAYADQKGLANTEDFRLPIEAEWEYAARGGHDFAPYPWGGYYVRNAKGCLLANFKPGRGNYPEDGAMYTARGDAYFPNDYGLYNMAGNVAEWTSSSFFENAYSFIHDMNPDIRMDAEDDDPKAWKRKVIRGGSWKDIAFYIQTGTRHWEYQDTAKSYIGFRNVRTVLGQTMSDFK